MHAVSLIRESIPFFLQIQLLDADGNPVTVETADCPDCIKERTPEEDLVPIIVGAAAGAAVLLILVILVRADPDDRFLKSFWSEKSRKKGHFNVQGDPSAQKGILLQMSPQYGPTGRGTQFADI